MSQYRTGIHPNGQTLWGQPMSTLRAITCLNCGHTGLFATDLPRIRQATEKHPERFTW